MAEPGKRPPRPKAGEKLPEKDADDKPVKNQPKVDPPPKEAPKKDPNAEEENTPGAQHTSCSYSARVGLPSRGGVVLGSRSGAHEAA